MCNVCAKGPAVTGQFARQMFARIQDPARQLIPPVRSACGFIHRKRPRNLFPSPRKDLCRRLAGVENGIHRSTLISTRRFRLDKNALPFARALINPDQPVVRPRNIKSGCIRRARHGDLKIGMGTALNLWYNYKKYTVLIAISRLVCRHHIVDASLSIRNHQPTGKTINRDITSQTHFLIISSSRKTLITMRHRSQSQHGVRSHNLTGRFFSSPQIIVCHWCTFKQIIQASSMHHRMLHSDINKAELSLAYISVPDI